MKKSMVLSSAFVTALGFTWVPSVAVASPAVSAVLHAPMIRAKLPTTSHGHGGHGGSGGGTSSSYGWVSSNWSGYAMNSGTYTDITGNWTVPTVHPGKKGNSYSSTWVGIDGFNNSNLIQTGTEQDYSNGSYHYYAWWEILPAPETTITTATNANGTSVPATVQPGDAMSAHISKNTNGTWNITLQDVSEGWTFTTTVSYSGPATSAEWIEEAPTIGGHVATLANYGTETLDPGTVNGASPGFVPSEDGAMVQHNSLVSVPSNPDSDVDGFNVAYGSSQPAAPAS